MKRKYAQEKKAEDAAFQEKVDASGGKLLMAPKGKEHLLETQTFHDMKEAKKQKKNPTFGWDVFNSDAILRAHEKRVDETQFQVRNSFDNWELAIYSFILCEKRILRWNSRWGLFQSS